MDRRQLLQGALAAVTASAGAVDFSLRARAQAKGEVVVASNGGAFQDAQREAFFKPFEQATGIRVVDVPGLTNAKIQAMGKARNMEWDVIFLTPVDLLLMSNLGYLQEIDYSQIDPKSLAGIDKALQQPFGLGCWYVTQVIGYSTKAFPAGTPHPDSWADVWDVKKFPGKRMLPAGDYVVSPIEAAIMADGVPLDSVYPIDLARAYSSLTRIRPEVVKWVNAAAAVPQALTDGSISVGFANASRIQDLMRQGAPVNFTWNQGITYLTCWAVLKGGPNLQNAMKFIDFAIRPEQQAAFSRLQPTGPTHRDAFDMFSQSEKEQFPSYPDNLKRQLPMSGEWWAAKTGAGKTNAVLNSEMWSKWILQ